MSVALVRTRWVPLGAGVRPLAGTGPLRPRPLDKATTSAVCLLVLTPEALIGALLTRVPMPNDAEPEAAPSGAPAGGPPVADEHLIAEVGETDPPELPIADVVVRGGNGHLTMRSGLSPGTTRSGSAGCLVTAVIEPGELYTVRTRDGWSAEIVEWPTGSSADWPFGWYASFVHSWLASGRRPDALDGALLAIARLPCACAGATLIPVGRHRQRGHWHQMRARGPSRPALP